MDIKTHILRWERVVGDNPAVLVLIIIAVLAVVFIGSLLVDGFLKDRKKKKRRRG